MKLSLAIASILTPLLMASLYPSIVTADVFKTENGPRFSVALSNGPRGIAVRALEKTYADFIGPSTTTPTAANSVAATTSGPLVVDPDIFDFKGTNYKLNRAIALRVAVEQDWRFSKRGYIYGEAAAFVAQRNYALPDGAGVLKDPISVSFNSVGAELRSGIRQQTHITPSLVVKTDLGLGIQQIRVRTSVQSALLNVKSTSHQTRPFVEIGVSLGAEIAQNHWQTYARLRGHKDRTLDVLFGIQLVR